MNNAPLWHRYDRQLPLFRGGKADQDRLATASVLVVGAGGLAAPVLTYLACAGVGRIGIVDADIVSVGNLNRQFLYEESDLGSSKATVAARRLRALNRDCCVTPHVQMLTKTSALALMKGYRAVVLCLDSIGARKVAGRAAVALKIPFVEGSVAGFQGTVLTCMPGKTACYHCLYAEARDSGQTVAVLGAMAGLVGSHMALATLDLLLRGEAYQAAGTLVIVNGLTHETAVLRPERDPHCAVCGDRNG